MYLKRFCANKRVDVWGPGVPAYPRRTESYVRDLLQDAAYSSGPTGFAREVAYHDYGGEDFEVGGIPVRVRPQRHSSPSFELRVGDLVTYATDTSFDPAAWCDSPQSCLLLHECWQHSEGDARHTSLEALAKGLPRDRFRKIVLVHQNPAWSADERDAVSRLATNNHMCLAHDGMYLELR
jgi:ribonuclease BN (tRNA processing enzyme)